MAPVSAPDRGDRAGVPRSRQPVFHRGADSSAHNWRIAISPMAGDKQHQPVTGSDRSIEAAVDRLPGGIEAVTVKIDDPVRRDGALGQAPVPSAIEGIANRSAARARSFPDGLRRW